MNRLCFSTLDPCREAPTVCGVCISGPPIFRYEFCDESDGMRADYMKGFCCARCASTLLTILEDLEQREKARALAGQE
jgi:hypothetical protein